MADQFDKIAQAIVDDCSDELNQTYEPAALKHEIAAALRKYGEIVTVTEQMRTTQKAYYKARKQSDLIASKQLERDVDDRIARLKRGNAVASDQAQAQLL
jgi:capsular polysaccharide biosynthesis protein